MFRTISSVLGVAFAFAIANIAQAEGSEIVGKWKGSILVNELPQPVFVEIKPLSAGVSTLSLKYSLPRNCSFSSQYSGQGKIGHVFRFIDGFGSSRSVCKKERKGAVLALNTTDTGKLRLEIRNGNSIVETIILLRR